MNTRSKTNMQASIRIVGARENNLRDIDVVLPVGQISCMTGISGSGKSSLVEDCLVAEAERRCDILNGRSHQFPLPYRPAIDGATVPFTILVNQGVLRWNSRSTVGTASGIIPRLRALVLPFCSVRSLTGDIVPPLDAAGVAHWLKTTHRNAAVSVMAILGRRVLGPLAPRINEAVTRYPKIQVCIVDTGEEPDITKSASPGKYKATVARTQRDIYAVTANSLSIRDDSRVDQALFQAFELARYPGGVGIVVEERGIRRFLDLEGALVHPSEKDLLFEPTETLLSFNSRLPRSGQCITCQGLGEIDAVDGISIIADPALPVAYGGLSIPFDTKVMRYRYFPTLAEEIAGFLVNQDFKQSECWKGLNGEIRHALLNGSAKISQPLSVEGRPRGRKKHFEGLITRVERALSGESPAATSLKGLHHRATCPQCSGSRLSYRARRVFIGNTPLDMLYGFSLDLLLDWLDKLPESIKGDYEGISTLRSFVNHCCNLGLGHLTLLRSTTTVSGGEGQRLRIARGLATHLTSAAYVLDEPTRGLHASDSAHLLSALRNLVSDNTSVLLVEHNPAVIRGVDHVLELGPGAGPDGGRIIYEGGPRQDRPTNKPDGLRRTSRNSEYPGWISLEKVSLRNIVQQSIRLPLGSITCFTGVSGSGKTTIVRDVLRPALEDWIKRRRTSGPMYAQVAVSGVEITNVLHVGQMALTDNPRSSILTYLNLADEFRNWFSEVSDASDVGIKSRHLSTNTAEGACATCEGLGRTSLDGIRHAVPCGACNGNGLRPQALFPTFENMNFSQWLDIPVVVLKETETITPHIRAACRLLTDLGLGHVSLGRRIPSLSGGENQRLRITLALLHSENTKARAINQHYVFLLDEPAAGLHISDTEKLLDALRRIVAGRKHTAILIEHSLHMIECADWIVEMGPGAADQGGSVLFQGSVADLKRDGPDNSLTRRALLGILPSIGKVRSGSSRKPSAGTDTDLLTFENVSELTPEMEDLDMPTMLHPTFVVDGGASSGNSYDLLALIGAALPLYKLFAKESSTPSGLPLTDEKLRSNIRAMVSREPNSLIGWFPATALCSTEHITWQDLRKAVTDHLAAGSWAWFDGVDVKRSRPPIAGGIDSIRCARMLMHPSLELESSIKRALALGEGWISIVNPETHKVVDFALRAIEMNSIRVGARWQVPQIFDRASSLGPCELCRGSGKNETLSESLIIADGRRGISDLKLFTPLAADALRSAFRKRMLPAVTRLAESGLIDLTVPYKDLDKATRAAVWYGYPVKAFLAPGGKPDVKSDWYQWRGLVSYLLRNVWGVSDRHWSEAVMASRNEVPCFECEGSGLGWEARLRRIGTISLQDIVTTWSVEKLCKWVRGISVGLSTDKDIDFLKDALSLATAAGLKKVRCGARLGSLQSGDRLLARALACHRNELLGATIIAKPTSKTERDRLEELLATIRQTTTMYWKVESAVHG